jgi:hypothetical protein
MRPPRTHQIGATGSENELTIYLAIDSRPRVCSNRHETRVVMCDGIPGADIDRLELSKRHNYAAQYGVMVGNFSPTIPGGQPLCQGAWLVS